MLYIHILFYSWKLTMLINAKEEAQSGPVLSFLLQVVQASSPCPTESRDIREVYSNLHCLLPATQPNFLVKETITLNFYH